MHCIIPIKSLFVSHSSLTILLPLLSVSGETLNPSLRHMRGSFSGFYVLICLLIAYLRPGILVTI